MNFPPMMINKYLGRAEEPQAKLEESDDQVYREITGGQVQHWGENGKLSSGRLTVKYAILHRIATINWVPT